MDLKHLALLLSVLLGVTFLGYAVFPYFTDIEEHHGKSILAGGIRELNSSGFTLFCNYHYLCEYGQTPDYRSYSVIPRLYLEFNDTVCVKEVSFEGSSQYEYDWGERLFVSFDANEFNEYYLTSSQNHTKMIEWLIHRKTSWTTWGNISWAHLIASGILGICSVTCLTYCKKEEA
jgi:hypothetical protein